MRRFFRTVPGKALLFVGCMAGLVLVVLSIVASVSMWALECYTRPESAVFDRTVGELAASEADDLLTQCIFNDQIFPVDAQARPMLRSPREATAVLPDDGTNRVWQLLDQSGRILARSQGAEEIQSWYETSWGVLMDREGFITDLYRSYGPVPGENERATYFTVKVGLKPGLPVQDVYQLLARACHLLYALRYWIYLIGLGALALGVTCLISLLCVSGRRPDREELVPGLLHRVPGDVMLGLWLAPALFTAYLLDRNWQWGDVTTVIVCACAGLLLANLSLGFCMSLAVRIKDRSLFRNTLIWRILRWLWRVCRWVGRGVLAFCRGIPSVWRTALITAGVCLLELFLMALWDLEYDAYTIWFMEKLLLVPAVIWLAICLRRLEKGGQALAKGNLNWHTSTRGMPWDLRRHGENLNSIGQGMTLAVEERLRSERLKTELITNVSHDLKTPLTSIINYADLICAEICDNPAITEYSEVLLRQSQRLRRLIDDLVEASKASTGSLEVHLAPCDALMFLEQTGGEYADKLSAANLTLLTKQPDQPVRIMADGRRMWRIFDNLMQNICKYSQPGTRVYLSLELISGHAVFTFKNTSREALDMSEQELLERFVRGDSSRNTEGNGLGLSIAKSLAELQGGTLRLLTDGDLFKVILTFPLM